MSSHLSRRTALIAAGQGMAALLLAACGKAAGLSATSPSPAVSSTSSGRSTLLPSAIDSQVTVPGLGSTGASSVTSSMARAPLTGTRIPLTPVTSSAKTSSQASVTSESATSSSARPSSADSASGVTSSTPTPTLTTSSRAGAASTGSLRGRVIAIDPGHNGANGEHPEIINQMIDGGYGQRHACNTTGTQTNDGYTEHEFAWHVAGYLKPLLEAKGITVVMTRSSDTGVGPCTDKRADIENTADCDAVVSIHGDGAPSEVRGFYVLTATRPPAGQAISAASLRLASCIAGAAIDAGFPASNTLGQGGLWTRDDLTGLNRSTRPKILIECGNMRNATEAAMMSSAAGQQQYAQALAQGVFAFLKG